LPLIGVVATIDQVFVKTEGHISRQFRFFDGVGIVDDDYFGSQFAMIQGFGEHRP
jgi:hypothetical protein